MGQQKECGSSCSTVVPKIQQNPMSVNRGGLEFAGMVKNFPGNLQSAQTQLSSRNPSTLETRLARTSLVMLFHS